MDAPPLPADLIDALRKAQRLTVLTGAGVSAESGVPTFRDKLHGLWEKFDAASLATPAAFERDPALVWGWYEWRRMTVLRAVPNAAHRAIAALRTAVPQVTIITQNVDDLHERAGCKSVLHLHGELARPYCTKCRRVYLLPDAIPELPPGGSRIVPPRCGACGAMIRPGVVWFGESLPAATWTQAANASRYCDAFLCVGTSSIVQPAASLTMMAVRASATTVVINPNPTEIDEHVGFALKGPAGSILPKLLREVWGISDGR